MTENEFYKTHRAFYEYMKENFPRDVSPFKPIRAEVVRAALVLAGASEEAALDAAPDNSGVGNAVRLFAALKRAGD